MSTVYWKDLTIAANIDARLDVVETAPGRTKVCVAWDMMEETDPRVTLSWSLPIQDIQYQWHPMCRKDRSLRVDWYEPVKSRISCSAPVQCFFNSTSRNRMTVALSDTLTEIDLSLGVHEEDGTLKCLIAIPLDKTGRTNVYTVTLYRDMEDVTFAQALDRVSRWWEQECDYTPMPVPEAGRLPLYSAWYSFHQATIAEEIEKEAARAKELGLDTIIVDDGWQTGDNNRGYGYCGDWRPCTAKIPDMKQHVKNVHALGMKYMLWYSVPFIGKWSEKWDAFKDMLLVYQPHINAGVLDPRYPQVRQYLIDTYTNALKDWDLDGFKLDFIDSFVPTTSAPAPAEGMDYINVEDAVLRLMTDVMTALKAIKPDILIEFRQGYIGPAMRTYGNLFRVGDCPNDPLQNRVGMVDLRLLSGSTAVHSDMLMWHKGDSVENAARQVLSVLFAVPQFSLKLDVIPENHLRMLRFWIGFFKEHRALLSAPLEVMSPQHLYPLVRSRLGDEEAIACYDEIVAPLSDASTIYLFNATGTEKLVLRDDENRIRRAQVYNCLGEWVREDTLPSSHLKELSLPIGGYACIQ